MKGEDLADAISKQSNSKAEDIIENMIDEDTTGENEEGIDRMIEQFQKLSLLAKTAPVLTKYMTYKARCNKVGKKKFKQPEAKRGNRTTVENPIKDSGLPVKKEEASGDEDRLYQERRKKGLCFKCG